MRNLYNKSLLDNISQRRQLNKMVTLASPAVWVSIVSACAIVGGLILWGFTGSIPTVVEATGLFMEQSSTVGQYSQYPGILYSYNISEKEQVKKGDLIATLASNDEYYRLRQLDDRIAHVENLTIDSDFTETTSDTEELAELKLKLTGVGDNVAYSEATLAAKRQRLAQLAGQVSARMAELNSFKGEYYNTLDVADSDAQFRYTEAQTDYDTSVTLYEQAQSGYVSAVQSYEGQKAQFDAKYEYFDYYTASLDEQATYDAEFESVQALADNMEDMRLLMEDAAAKAEENNQALTAARDAYLLYLNEQSGRHAENTIASTEYSEALSAYNTALSEYNALLTQISDYEINHARDKAASINDAESIHRQFESKKEAVLSQLRRQREDVLHELDGHSIYATETGSIYKLDTIEGRQVSAGEQIASLVTEGQEEATVICFVPIRSASKISEGMEVHIFLSSVNKYEYGYITGRVRMVEDRVETREHMNSYLDNESTVDFFYSQGALVTVLCSLDTDPKTVSGFKWSGAKGAEVPVVAGTYADISLITEEKRPIDIFIPYIEGKLEFSGDEDKQNGKPVAGE